MVYYKPNYIIKFSKDVNGVIYKGDCTDFLEMFETNSVDLTIIDHDWEKLISKNGTSANIAINAYMVRVKDWLSRVRQIVVPAGRVCVHCNWQTDAETKILMYDIFNRSSFMANIRWCYLGGGRSTGDFARKHDTILVFKNRGNKPTFNAAEVSREISEAQKKRYNKVDPITGQKFAMMHGIRHNLPEWTYREDWWADISPLASTSKERIGVDYQKPQLLIDRLIKAYSNPGDLVMDYMAASGVTAISANELDRRWIICEIVSKKVDKILNRLEKAGIKMVTEKEYLLNMSWEEVEEWVCNRLNLEKTDRGTYGFDAKSKNLNEAHQIKKWENVVGGSVISKFVTDLKRKGFSGGMVIANRFSEIGDDSAIEVAAWAKLNEDIDVKLVKFDDVVSDRLYYKITDIK